MWGTDQLKWKCMCGNNATGEICRGCSRKKGDMTNKELNERIQMAKEGKKKKQPWGTNKGDWKCVCGEENFSKRDICRNCSRKKEENITDEELNERIQKERAEANNDQKRAKR